MRIEMQTISMKERGEAAQKQRSVHGKTNAHPSTHAEVIKMKREMEIWGEWRVEGREPISANAF
jgi:hypothetical protein